MQHLYLIALGSNRRHHRHGTPRAVLSAVVEALGELGAVEAVAPVMNSRPLGPSRRAYANGAVLLSSDSDPLELLAALKRIERRFGRRRGRQWGERTLDLDIILWSGGAYSGPGLVIPHPHFRERDFVLKPATAIAPRWRDPLTGRTLAQLNAHLSKN